MAAYCIGLITISDPSWVEEYSPKVQALVESHGGKYLVRNMEMEKVEGEGAAPTVSVILEFPSMAQAKAWYHSDEYAPLLKSRLAGASGDFIMVDGL